MSIAAIQSDLTNLVSESRRRNHEIRHAAEKSLSTLKSYDSSIPEATFVRNLASNPSFITPFILSCQLRNAKFSALAIHSLQLLISANALSFQLLETVLDSLAEASHLPLEIQLKVLQVLPTVYQVFGDQMNGKYISKLLYICAILQGPSKPQVVVNTAAATLQQLVIFIFDKAGKTDGPKTNTITINKTSLLVSDNILDCYNIFQDLCSLIEHSPPSFLQVGPFLAETFLLDLIELILNNFYSIFISQAELGHLLKLRLTPIFLRSLSHSGAEFAVVIRCARVVSLLLRKCLSILHIEAEIILLLLNHILLDDTDSPEWKKHVVLEVYSAVFSDFKTALQVFTIYDNVHDRKHVLNDFLVNSFCWVNSSSARHLLDYRPVLHPPIVPSELEENPPFIVHLSDSQKSLYSEMLDKTDPPAPSKNHFFALILSSFSKIADGLGSYVMELPQGSDLSVIKSLVLNNYKVLLGSFEVFLHLKLSNETFHSLTRSLQKLCYAAGLLGVEAARDTIVEMLSLAAISNSAEPRKTSIGGLLLSSLSHVNLGLSSLATSLSQTTKSPQSPTISANHGLVLHSRYLHSRHLIAVRALANLGVLLGPQFGDWTKLFVTMQWVDYYVNGPSLDFDRKFTYASNVYGSQPTVKQNELAIVQSVVRKLVEALKSYKNELICGLFRTLTDLQDKVIAVENSKEAFEKVVINCYSDESEILVCPYHRYYFLDLMGIFSTPNSERFMEENLENSASLIFQYLCKMISNRDLGSSFRIRASVNLYSLLGEVAGAYFAKDKSTLLEEKLLEALLAPLLVIQKDQIANHDELLGTVTVLGLLADSDIIKRAYDALRGLLDTHGARFLPEAWSHVFVFVETCFSLFPGHEPAMLERKLEATHAAFLVLQLALGDFLGSLPADAVRIASRTAAKFTTQECDINTLLSAVGHFWRLSDHVRGLIEHEKKPEYYELWLSLLRVLVSVALNARDQVRNGAVQTLFQILDSPPEETPWDSCYRVVLKALFEVIPARNASKSWTDTLLLIVGGSVRLYSTVFANFSVPESELAKLVEYWEGLVGYFKNVLALQWTLCDLKIYSSFSELVSGLENVPERIGSLLFSFWASRNVSYTVSASKQCQEALTALMKAYSPLRAVVPMTEERIKASLALCNAAVRYPVLPTYFADNIYPTDLQKAVLDNMASMGGLDVVQQLVATVVLPFSTRAKIKNEVGVLPKDAKVCTFVAVSYYCVVLLRREIEQCSVEELVESGTAERILSMLLEPVKISAKGIAVELKGKLSAAKALGLDLGGVDELWVECVDIIGGIIQSVANHWSSGQPTSIPLKFWQLSVELYRTVLSITNNSPEHERFNVEMLSRLKKVLVAIIEGGVFTPELLTTFTRNIFESLFLYNRGTLAELLKGEAQDMITQLVHGDLDADTPIVAGIVPVPRYRIGLICLNDMVVFLIGDGILAKEMRPFFVARAAYALRTYLSTKAFKGVPLSKIQNLEISVVLQGLIELGGVKEVMPLMVKGLGVEKDGAIMRLFEGYFQEVL